MRIVGYVLGLLTLFVGLATARNKTYTVRSGDPTSGFASKLASRQADSSAAAKAPKLGVGQAALSLASLASPKTANQVGERVYTVKPGDCDWVIAKRFNLSEHQLHLLNPGVDWKHLQLGRQVRVSGGNAPIQQPRVAHNAPTKKPAAAKPAPVRTYTAKKGDNDWVVAIRAGISPKALRLANPDIDWDRLQIGQKIRLPGGSDRVAVASHKTTTIRSRYAKIARDSVVVRRSPGAGGDKVTVVEAGLAVKVLDRDSGWYKLKFPKGTVGWVRGDMLKAAQNPTVVARKRSRTTTRVARHRRTRSSSSGQRYAVAPPADASPLLKRAYSRMGQRYVYGANDCSGFVMSVYRTQGVRLPHSSRAQSGLGNRVRKGDLKPGDLVFFKTNRGTRINHVGIYTGNGKFIHASSGGGKVQVNSLNDGYYQKRFAGGRRVTKAKKKK